MAVEETQQGWDAATLKAVVEQTGPLACGQMDGLEEPVIQGCMPSMTGGLGAPQPVVVASYPSKPMVSQPLKAEAR